MENNNPNDELLVEYLVSNINADEKDHVESWINASDENRRYFESLKRAWQLSGEEKALNYVLDELDVDGKWNGIKQAIAGSDRDNNQILADGENHDQQQNYKTNINRLFIRVAIAASVLVVISLGWKFLFTRKPDIRVTQRELKRSESLTPALRHEVNTTGKEKRIPLADGSLIVLAPKSEITYGEPFSGKRDIILVGKAFFRVAKDKTKPFTVFSGDISTTALGTQFTVTTFRNNRQIIVRLYEGKVVVKAIDVANKKLKKDVYLLPGQSFVYQDQTIAKVKEFKINSAAAPELIIEQELPLDIPSLPENAKGPYFMFNNQSLGDVFDNLAELYNVNIVYDKKDVKNLYLIAKYNSSDSLETILRRITTVNSLTVNKKDKAYIISK